MRKTRIFIFFILIIAMAILGSKCVKAYSGEIDPEYYISFPMYTFTTNNIFSIDVTSSKLKELSNYTLYQQEIEISDELLEKINAATSQAERLALITDFDNSKWKKISGTKAEIDLAAFSGKKNIILWIRLDIEQNSYYDYTVYSLDGTKSTSNTTDNNDSDGTKAPSDDAQNGNNKPADNVTTAKVTITDSNGEDFCKGNLTTSAYAKIEGINFDSSKNYYVAITHSKTEPQYDKNNFSVLDKTTKLAKVSSALEESGDLYIWLYEEDNSTLGKSEHTTLILGQKVERPEYPTLGNRIIYAGLSKAFSTNIPRMQSGLMDYRARKITIKIGRVTDTNVLNEIKNKDTRGMSDLLSYAKSSSAELTTIINSTSNLTTGNNVDLSKLDAKKGAYYYVYFVMEDENGTYYPIEDVNLLYSIGNNILCNQNEDGFKWDIISTDVDNSVEDNKDDTVAPTNLAKTGEKATVVAIIIGAIIVITVSKWKTRKMKF